MVEKTLTKIEILELLRDAYIKVLSEDDLVSAQDSGYFFKTIFSNKIGRVEISFVSFT